MKIEEQAAGDGGPYGVWDSFFVLMLPYALSGDGPARCTQGHSLRSSGPYGGLRRRCGERDTGRPGMHPRAFPSVTARTGRLRVEWRPNENGGWADVVIGPYGVQSTALIIAPPE